MPDVRAEREACFELFRQLRSQEDQHLMNTGQWPEAIAVFAGMRLFAALRRGDLAQIFWRYDPATGRLIGAASRRAEVLLAQEPSLGLWQYTLIVGGSLTGDTAHVLNVDDRT